MDLEYGEIIYKTQTVKIQQARNRENNQLVCVKQYRLSTETQQKSFYNEISHLYRLNTHPNVLKIIGHNRIETNGEYHVEMILEYCSRGDLCTELNRRISGNVVWNDADLLGIIKTLVSTFKFLQEEKIAHRDIKPDNILVTDSLELKVSDLGASSYIKSKSNLEMQTIVGTSYYMSPELRIGYMNLPNSNLEPHMTYDAFRSDVWSLGLTLLTIVSLKSIEDFNDVHKAETVARSRLSQIRNPTIRVILENMLVVDYNKRKDFIELDSFIKQVIAKASQCIICQQKTGQTIWCLFCFSYVHPECLKNIGNCKCTNCNTVYQLEDTVSKCSKCNYPLSLSIINVCNHLSCRNCSYLNIDCLYCFGLRTFNHSEVTVFQPYLNIYCRDCNVPLDYTNWNTLNCKNCAKTLCAICKSSQHENSCSLQQFDYEIYCRCRLWRPKSSGSLFFNCPLCIYVCIVCYGQSEKSHFHCSALFSSKKNQL
jgi:serine/threonine protein kinase